jgi:hypothetical protein
MVAASSKDTLVGILNVECAQPTAYSAKLPPGESISWNEATRSPGANSQTEDPTLWTTPAMSSPELAL